MSLERFCAEVSNVYGGVSPASQLAGIAWIKEFRGTAVRALRAGASVCVHVCVSSCAVRRRLGAFARRYYQA